MKKITLLLLVAFYGVLNAQTVVWSDDFEDKKIDDWTLVDADGDKENWFTTTYVTKYDSDFNPISNTNAILSMSIMANDDGLKALTPNNYIISPKIDLTNASGKITLKWKATPSESSEDDENYAVYVADSKNVEKLLASSVKTDKLNLKGVEELTQKTLDLSSFAGKSEVYVAFRHYESTNHDGVVIDDVSVEADVVATASTQDLALSNVNILYDSNELTVNANDVLDSAEVFNILGKRTLSKKLSSNSESINISNLNSGIYILRVSAQGKLKTFKFVK